jgi:nucleotide-binding universal stress UspA family protein
MEKLLLAVDDSEASWRAVEQTAALIKDQPDAYVHIFHAIGPVPTSLQEFRGAEDPVEERILDRDLKSRQDAWLQNARAAGDLLLARAQDCLAQSGSSPDRISTETVTLRHREDLPAEILHAAHVCGCTRIIVGRNSFSWMDELFSDHLGEQIQKTADGVSVSVVG